MSNIQFLLMRNYFDLLIHLNEPYKYQLEYIVFTECNISTLYFISFLLLFNIMYLFRTTNCFFVDCREATFGFLLFHPFLQYLKNKSGTPKK